LTQVISRQLTPRFQKGGSLKKAPEPSGVCAHQQGSLPGAWRGSLIGGRTSKPGTGSTNARRDQASRLFIGGPRFGDRCAERQQDKPIDSEALDTMIPFPEDASFTGSPAPRRLNALNPGHQQHFGSVPRGRIFARRARSAD
jgi:hypothetical protein